jgi:hypothetical protein
MTQDNPQKQEVPPIAVAGAALLIPVVGIPLALHALSGAAIGGFTFLAANLILASATGKNLNPPELLASKSSDTAEGSA